MDTHKTINLHDLPHDPFEAREVILGKTGRWILSESTKYIKERYNSYEMLEYAVRFFTHDLLDAAPSDGNNFIKLGLFPWREASREMEKALSLIMLPFYKNSYDSMRRALELVVVGAYFILENIETETAHAWLKSEKHTPNFRRAIKTLVKYEPYSNCEHKCQFSEFILSIYHKLSGYIHIRGIEKSHEKLMPYLSRFNSIEFLKFHESSCQQSLDLFIETIQSMSLIYVLTIPRLLVGFDFDSKFGLNSSFSGFFTSGQAKRVHMLIPESFRTFIDDLEKKNEEIRSVKELVDSIPDISEEEFNKQCEKFKELFMLDDDI